MPVAVLIYLREGKAAIFLGRKINILIPGGAGYIGAWMVPHLLADGHNVTVYDTLYFGNGHLPENGMLELIRGDVRNQDSFRAACEGQDAAIYFASISQDAMCQASPDLAQSINVDAFGPCVLIAKQCGVKRFIYASSVAVYGSSDHDATEDEELKPTTLYAKGKAACESILHDFQSRDFCTTITRSASVCGYSPHYRLDLTINRMAYAAWYLHKIKVEGGSQKRSHIHIKDITAFYKLLLKAAVDQIAGETFNIVTENQRVKDTAALVARVIGHTAIEVGPRTDDRSYSVDGSKAKSIGFEPKYRLEEAVRDLQVRFESKQWDNSLAIPRYLATT